jgi:WD40-like Beta Propeller Repeat
MDGLQNDTAGRLRGRRERKPSVAAAIAVVAVVPSRHERSRPMIRGSTWNTRAMLVVGTALLVLAAAAAAAAGPHFSTWTNAVIVEDPATPGGVNTPQHDGCPIASPDGLSMYIASNRPGGKGLLDIWVVTRESTSDPWGPATNLPESINSAADDFCPTPVRGNGLFFVSRRTVAGVTCGMGDIYFTRRNPAHGWSEPQHLGCAPDGPNTPADEMGPSYFEADGQGHLYFSSGPDIYASEQLAGGGFGPGSPVASLNSTAADIQPNVRKDGREVVFASNRSGTLGSQDIWAATRESVDNPWSTPVNLGPAINTADSETRPSLSWDARTLLFGRAPAAGPPGDVYVSTREKLGG